MLQCIEEYVTRRKKFAYIIFVGLIRDLPLFIAYKSPEISVNKFVLD